MTAGPSWYDLLGVASSADPDEIRAAWRAGIADLDPADRRFRSLSSAAEVLLDPEARATYDASLVAPVAPVAAVAATERARSTGPAGPTGPTAPVSGEPRPVTGSRLPLVPAWVLLLAAVLAALGVATATLASVQAGEPVSDEAGSFMEQSAEEARAAAIRAVVPVLSFDYRSLDQDAAAARSYMTSAYQEEKYDPLFAVIEENAPNTQTVVTVQVVDSAVVRTGEDRVDVLVFMDRPTTNRQSQEPVVYKDQATVTMARVDGQWLVDDLTTSPIQQ